MEDEIDKLYPTENSVIEDFDETEEQQEEPAPQFVYKPVEVQHKVDIFALLLIWTIIGILGYVLFATTSVFE